MYEKSFSYIYSSILSFTQLILTLELGLYHTPTLAAHLYRFPQNQIQIP